jgi:hypothetical protein
MRSCMEQAARFEKYNGKEKTWKPAKPPEDIADLILARSGHWPFPPIRGVLAAPALRSDGSIIETAGYDAATGTYLFNLPPVPDIPERPTMVQGKQACSTTSRGKAGCCRPRCIALLGLRNVERRSAVRYCTAACRHSLLRRGLGCRARRHGDHRLRQPHAGHRQHRSGARQARDRPVWMRSCSHRCHRVLGNSGSLRGSRLT